MIEKLEEVKQKRLKNKRKNFQNKHSRQKSNNKLVSVADFEFQVLREELRHDAKALRIPEGAADEIAKNVIDNAERWLNAAGKATIGELHEEILAELQKYHADLAYVYQNRGKII